MYVCKHKTHTHTQIRGTSISLVYHSFAIAALVAIQLFCTLWRCL